ncbi:MAG: hypothetical protein N2037_10310 [Acidimicrobiales bacterium]|nr:hypothetical protein [Acidimicrobiales bacterium]
MPLVPAHDLVIVDLLDALQLTIDLYDRFGRFHAVVPLGTDGSVMSVVAFTGPRPNDYTDVNRAALIVMTTIDTNCLLLASYTPYSQREPHEADIEVFHRVSADFRKLNIEILDWVLTDGEHLRSMAYTCRGGWSEPWPSEP